MEIKTSWYMPGRIIYNEVPPVFTEDDLIPHNQIMLAFLNDTLMHGHFVHAIWDFTHSLEIPSAFKQVQAFTFPRHPRLGWSAFVGIQYPFTRFSLLISSQVFKARVRQFATMSEAIIFIEDIEAHLNPAGQAP